MISFINRKEELGALNSRARSGRPECIPIYGRRRVGKTELIKQFCRNKKTIYLLATLVPERETLEGFSKRIAETFHDRLLMANPLRSWDALLLYLAGKAERERLVVVFDEFPYLVRRSRGLPSILQAHWDEKLSKSKVFLILCGSFIGMMEREVLGHKSPLYGRRTGQMFIGPLNFRQACEFFPAFDIKQKIEAYAILGGLPAYLLEFGDRTWITENIRDKILRPDAFLYNEIPFILREELREPANYFAILKAIAFGRTSLNEIVQASGLERAKVAKYLDTLADLRLVERRLSVTEKYPHKSRKGLYAISDHYFRFWFRFVYPNRDYIEIGRGEHVLDEIKSTLAHFVAYTFEDVCRQYIRERGWMKVGSWWHKGEEIDLVALDERKEQIVLGECKWSNRPMGMDALISLKRKREHMGYEKGLKEKFILFSKAGFSPSLIKAAKNEGIELVGLKEIEEA